MAPREVPAVPAGSATKGAQSKRRWQFPDSKTSFGDVTTSTSVSKRLKQSHPSLPTPVRRDRTRLLDLDTALVLQIAKAVDPEDLPKLMRGCQALWTIGLDALYNNQVRFSLGPRFPPSGSLVGYGPTFSYIHRFTRDVTIGITARSGAQDYFQMLAPTLQHTSLTSLIFRQPGLSDEHQQGPIRSALNGQSWLVLEDTLCNDIRGLNLRDSLRNIDLPELCDPPTMNSSGQHVDDTLLDSRIILKFVSTLLQPGKLFRFAAAGRKETGALRRVARRLLQYVGVGAHIDFFYMRGSDPDKDTGIYRNPFLDLGLEQKFALTKLVFHDFNFRDLPGTVAYSVDLSSVRSLRLIQCLDTEGLFFFFMKSDFNSQINIEDLCIHILDWDEPLLWGTHGFAFTKFITSFNSLQSVCMKVCNTWVGARSEYPRLIDIWRYHPGLRAYDVDFGNENDLSLRDMDSLASYCPGLEVFGSRDIVLGAPIYDGDWSEFDDEAPYITETLAAEFHELKTWKIYYNTGPLFKNEEGDDFHRLVASCLFDFFREACEEYKVECKLKTIILIAQDDVIPDHIFLRDGLSQGLTYNF